jgi:hypothetical protein
MEAEDYIRLTPSTFAAKEDAICSKYISEITNAAATLSIENRISVLRYMNCLQEEQDEAKLFMSIMFKDIKNEYGSNIGGDEVDDLRASNADLKRVGSK